MRFGLFGGARSVPSDPARGYNEYLDYLLEAENLGYTGCFLTKHHFTGWGQVSALAEAGATTVLANILGQHKPGLRRPIALSGGGRSVAL